MDEHVVWSGSLCHWLRSEENLEYWATDHSRRRWAVLVRPGASVFGGSGKLQLYRELADYESASPAATVLCLDDALRVELDADRAVKATRLSSASHRSFLPPRLETFTYKFTITTAKETHVLGARTGGEASLWVDKLNQLLPDQRIEPGDFLVRVLPTALSKRLSLQSSHVLKVSEFEVSLYDREGVAPTSFTCPLGNITKVDNTHGAGSGVITLHCIHVCGSSGTLTFSTDNTAELSRILNRRRSLAAASSTDQLLYSQQDRLQQQHNHDAQFADSADQVSSSSQSFVQDCHSSSSSSSSLTATTTDSTIDTTNLLHRRGCQSCASGHDVHSLPPRLRIRDNSRREKFKRQQRLSREHNAVATDTPLVPGSLLNRIVMDERESSSSSDSEEEDDERTEMVSRRKESGTGGDFESVASWVSSRIEQGHKVNCLPELTQPQITRPLHPATLGLSTGGPSGQSGDGRLVSTSVNELSESPDNDVRLQERTYHEVTPDLLNKKGEFPDDDDDDDTSSVDANEAYDHDIDSWRVGPSVSNGKDHQHPVMHQYATTGGHRLSLHDYEDIRESVYTEVEESRETLDASTPDYDYVKHRILGVRGLPIKQPSPQPYSSDEEEENYYY